MLFFVFSIYKELYCIIFFFSSRRRHTRCGRDWSSDVCSSDLQEAPSESVALLCLVDGEACQQQDRDRLRHGFRHARRRGGPRHRPGGEGVVADYLMIQAGYERPGRAAGLIGRRVAEQPFIEAVVAAAEPADVVIGGQRLWLGEFLGHSAQPGSRANSSASRGRLVTGWSSIWVNRSHCSSSSGKTRRSARTCPARSDSAAMANSVTVRP